MSETSAKATFADRAADATPPAVARRVRSPLRPGDRLALHQPDDRPSPRHQHLPADLDDLSLVHQLQGQPAERADPRRRHDALHEHPDRPRHLALDAGDGAFRLLDGRARDADRLRPRLSHRPALPRPRLLDDRHPDPDDAVAGGGRQFLEVPLPAADRPLQLRRLLLHRRRPVRRSRCSAKSRWRPGRSSSSTSGCGRPT